MRYEIRSVWEEGEDCLKKYKEDLEPFNPSIKAWWKHNEEDTKAWKKTALFIELNSLDDLENLVTRLDEVIIHENHLLEIYDDYRE